ncbi:ATP-binding cassette domain-containing protein [Agarilytica rhodophyticola]|uniref:ATP-binding cassette domain-containing protein n=1 Tax=Agarilytica rhodophyticola TaxID=1737490 RepID=UPI000B343B65|nr:ATP-binding cassette domain-containing protein [Agarilytica rhodophyticola]
MIQLDQIHLQLGSKELFADASLTIYPGQKWGLIGQNGAGKTSLFKLFLGELHEDKGRYSIPKNWLLSHMGQEVAASSQTALDYILDGDKELRQLEQEIAQCEGGEKLAHLYEKMESIQGYSATSRAQQLLHGLGFNNGDDGRKVTDFSGGWRIRLNLAQALMCRSDFLLLDEPTNHLDLDATYWLENWLNDYRGTLLIVSHDREFLDNVVGNIVSIHNRQLDTYVGNYSSYEKQKAERLAQQAAAYKKQQERVAEIEDFVRRFRAKATKAKQAQSRLKELERMEMIAPAHIESPFSFRFPTPEKLPQSLINLSQAAIGYGADKVLADKIELNILSTSRIGLLGSNGAGKSTLMKTLAGENALVQGDLSEGTHLRIGYFAQHQLEALDLDASCALHLQRIKPQESEQSIRNFLGSFGFSGDRAFENITHFSGGEKARLALAIVAWQKPNLLLLDEPTNHLDLEVRHALTLALQMFEGAIVVVSHDRHLLKNTVDTFLLVDNNKVQTFDGTLDDYHHWLLNKNQGTGNNTDNDKNIPKDSPNTDKSSDKKSKRQAAAAAREKLKPLTNAIKKLEKDIEKYQQALDQVTQELADPSLYEGNNEKLQTLIQQQKTLRETLESKEESWMEKTEELEMLNA